MSAPSIDRSTAPELEPATAWLEAFRQRNTERSIASGSQLPLWPEAMRGVPNGILRSALFGAVRRGKRRYMERQSIASMDGVTIVYTGLRLDQSDLDVWEGVLHLARLTKLGDRIEFTEKGFLRLIGRGGVRGDSIGKSDREWLRKVLARLSATNVEIEQGPYAFCGSLIDEYFRDASSRRYVLILNPRMKVIFNRDSWTQIDWNIRHELRGHPLAQWLHGFYSTHAAPFPVKVETLHKLCGSETGESAKSAAEHHKAIVGWRDDSLEPALEALRMACQRFAGTFVWDICRNGLVHVARSPSAAQQRYLRARTGAPPLVGIRARSR